MNIYHLSDNKELNLHNSWHESSMMTAAKIEQPPFLMNMYECPYSIVCISPRSKVNTSNSPWMTLHKLRSYHFAHAYAYVKSQLAQWTTQV
jgi:hypothetical protein